MLSLDAIDMTVTLENRVERLSEDEYLLLEQMLRFSEQPLRRESLLGTLSGGEFDVPDRVLNQRMTVLIRKINVLHPAFPLLRRLTRDVWIYTEVAPKKKA